MRPDEQKLLRNALPGAVFVGAMWFVHLMAWLTGLDLAFLGVFPRHRNGIAGIFLAPLIHADLLHLLSNSFPLLLLSAFLFSSYRKIAVEVWIWTYLTTGFWTFLLARQAHHIGASGIVYGLASFLLFIGLFRRDRNSIALSAVILVLYGGLVYGVLPLDSKISWESHLFGAIAGLLLAWFFRNYAPALKKAKPQAVIPEQVLSDPFAPWNLTLPEVWLDSETFHMAQLQKQQIEEEASARLQPEQPEAQNQLTPGRPVYYNTDQVFPVTFKYVYKGAEQLPGKEPPAQQQP